MIKLRQLRTELRAMGFEVRRGRGSHEIWTDPTQPQRRVTLAGSNGADALKYQLTRVRRFQRGMMVFD